MDVRANGSIDPFRAVFLFGPTASGKTDMLSSLELPGLEVVNADSMQVYRGLDIGTAKPADCSVPPYHLLDIRDPQDQFTVADFVPLAEQAVSEILSRGGMPLVSGGTAFYFKHLWFGLPESPPGNAEIRKMLEQRHASEGLAALRAELETVDPQSNQRIQANDAYRVIRALEVYKTSGRPLSSWKIPSKPLPGRHVRAYGLEIKREHLYERINMRVEKMFEAGFINEVRELVRSGCRPEYPAMRAIGYRECFDSKMRSCIHSDKPVPEKLLRMLIARIQQASRHYAKRQMTFFKCLPDVQWIEPEDLPILRRNIQNFFGY